MIEILKSSEKGFIKVEKPEDSCWINVINPTETELFELKTIIDLPEEILLSLQDKEEIPTIEKIGSSLFILLKTPNRISELKYNTVPLGIIISDTCIITICFHDNDVIKRVKCFAKQFQKKDLVLRMMYTTSKIYLNYLNEINATIDVLESKLYKSQKNREIAQLLGLEQSLVYFSTSLQSNEILVQKIAKDKSFAGSEESREMISNILDETMQAIRMTKIYTDILSNLMDAFVSMISNNLNVVMKVLTSITILISVPTLIASIYGMNISLPLQHLPNAFTFIMLISVGFSLLFLFFFWKNELI